jgi:hypothetical protein
MAFVGNGITRALGCNKSNKPPFSSPCSGGQCNYNPKTAGINSSNLYNRKHSLAGDDNVKTPLSAVSSVTSDTNKQENP